MKMEFSPNKIKSRNFEIDKLESNNLANNLFNRKVSPTSLNEKKVN